MYATLTPDLAQRNKAVYLTKELPAGRSFGNRRVIPAGSSGYPTRGYITSMGFEAGRLQVLFPLYQGDERTEFNELSAAEYLECDPFF